MHGSRGLGKPRHTHDGSSCDDSKTGAGIENHALYRQIEALGGTERLRVGCQREGSLGDAHRQIAKAHVGECLEVLLGGFGERNRAGTVDTLGDLFNLGTFYLLQIRPIVDSKEMLDEDLTLIPDEDVVLRSNNSLGHGVMNEIYDIVYVKTDGYSASNNQAIAWEIEKMNLQFLNAGRNYVLVGPWRWGSSDTWLGIPVKWPHISAARVIVEAGLTNYRVDPSQGTHFFQNLTSFGVGYFTINAFMNDGVYNQDFLNAQPAVEETKFLRHVRFEKPMVVKMDGKKKLGVVLMPGID